MERKYLITAIFSICLIALLTNTIAAQSKTGLKNYKNDKHGFSFSYPADWNEKKLDPAIIIFAAKAEANFEANINVTVVPIDQSMTASKKAFQDAYSANFKNCIIEELSDISIGGQKGRKLVYKWNSEGVGIKQAQYFYTNKDKMYVITCTMPDNKSKKYMRIFDSIISTYKIKATHG